MKQFKLSGIILIVVALIGCQGALQQPPSVCDSIQPGESVICDMSQKIGQKPETVAGILKLANIGGLSADLYTAQQADKFLGDIIEALNLYGPTGITYADAVTWVLGMMANLPPEVQALFIVLDDYLVISSGKMLTQIDINMLVSHLQEQKLIVLPFLGSD